MEKKSWLVARRFAGTREDTKEMLVNFGFEVIDDGNDLFYNVYAPIGWQQVYLSGSRTCFFNENGSKGFSQFAKTCNYDRGAHVFPPYNG